MKKYGPIVNHGTLIDTVNVNSLIEAQANQPAFLGTSKKVVSVKTKNKGNVRTLKKVRSTLK